MINLFEISEKAGEIVASNKWLSGPFADIT